MNSISQNPDLLKILTNFEIQEADNTVNMFSTFIKSNKSRSLVYKLVFARLKELASSKILDYNYDYKNSSFKINICEYCYFRCIVSIKRNEDINDFCKFIFAKICDNIYRYLLLHRFTIPSQFESKINSMMKYMNNYEHSKNITFKNVLFDYKTKSQSLIDAIFNLIACSTFPEIRLQIFDSDISNCLRKSFSKIMKLPACRVQKIFILNKSIIDCENPSSKNQIKVMLAENGVNNHTDVLYKFLENSGLLDSIKEIEFVYSLESLIVEYQRKNNMQCGISIQLREYSFGLLVSIDKAYKYFYSMISNLIQFAQILLNELAFYLRELVVLSCRDEVNQWHIK